MLSFVDLQPIGAGVSDISDISVKDRNVSHARNNNCAALHSLTSLRYHLSLPTLFLSADGVGKQRWTFTSAQCWKCLCLISFNTAPGVLHGIGCTC